MAFENILDISKVDIKSGDYFFIDANIWIYALNGSILPSSPDKGNPVYSKFFNEVVNFEEKPRPRIVICSLLVSEIINTYLRKYAMKDFIFLTYTSKGQNPPPNFEFKRDYRSTSHFETHYELIRNEIKAYNQSIEPLDDSFIDLKPFQILKDCPKKLDYNDYYYYLLTKRFSKNSLKKIPFNFAFVTNDGDFEVNDLSIYTALPALLNLKK